MSWANLTLAANRLTAAAAACEALPAAYQAALDSDLARRNSALWFYVHQITGLDTNTGSNGSPLRSIREALSRVPVAGVAHVVLQADYTLDARDTLAGHELIVGGARTLRIASAGGDRARLIQAPLPGVTASRTAAGISVEQGAQVQLDYVRLVTCPVGAQGALAAAGMGSLFKVGWQTWTGLSGVSLYNAVVETPADNLDALVFAPGGCLLTVFNLQAGGAALAGRLVHGAAAGDSAASRPGLVTNLSTL